jgi:hypothetical protein
VGIASRMWDSPGPCGYGIQRQLAAWGYHCIVVVPLRIPKAAGARVKTNRRDADKLARSCSGCARRRRCRFRIRITRRYAAWYPPASMRSMPLRRVHQRLPGARLRRGFRHNRLRLDQTDWPVACWSWMAEGYRHIVLGDIETSSSSRSLRSSASALPVKAERCVFRRKFFAAGPPAGTGMQMHARDCGGVPRWRSRILKRRLELALRGGQPSDHMLAPFARRSGLRLRSDPINPRNSGSGY